MSDYVEAPLTQSHRARAAELVLAYLERPDPDGLRHRYEELMEHTVAEFEPDTMMSALITIFVGFTSADDHGLTELAGCMRVIEAQPKEDNLWLSDGM